MTFSSSMNFPASAVPRDFGGLLAARRIELGWSQARLARMTGLRRETIVRLERGRRAPTADTVFRLQAALNLEPGELVPAWPEWSPIGLPTYGARTRQRRRDLGLSLDMVAAAVGVSAATLSRFERELVASRALAGGHDGPSIGDEIREKALAIALGFESAIDYRRFCMGQ
ncbi:helix-turn-helix transcriptional regulator [Sphingomonas sp. 2SG]|uniref:helix-turn-helix domain-containing protein n=1 Tax=Sphingomonas sp. 2SG TaxID=2502201 RepID=UPI0010F7F604|nr:helix-turn-helix transcriptional regulator [Sphingomonas sp. 2SG]